MTIKHNYMYVVREDSFTVIKWRMWSNGKKKTKKTQELGHSISYTTAWRVPSEGSDQPAYPHSLIRVFVGTLYVTKDPKRLQADSEDPDQADLSLRWVYIQICRKYCAPAHMWQKTKKSIC